MSRGRKLDASHWTRRTTQREIAWLWCGVVLFVDFGGLIVVCFVESLSEFLVGEGKLESYLEEHPPLESNINHAKLGLIEGKRHLQQVTGEDGIRVGVSGQNKWINVYLLFFDRREFQWTRICCWGSCIMLVGSTARDWTVSKKLICRIWAKKSFLCKFSQHTKKKLIEYLIWLVSPL